MAYTIRCDSLELWPGLVLHGMGEVDFHVFLEILETHFITKYFQIGPRASRLVLGFLFKARVPFQELSNKVFLQKMTPRKKTNRETGQPPKIVILFIKWLPS